MKKIRQGFKRICSRQGEAGYVLTWVLILSLVAGFVLAPFLAFMLTGVRASFSYADAMSEFYAADSGIEDGIHKIAQAYSAEANLTDDLDDDEDIIDVDDTALFPERGIIRIGTELIRYSSKDGTHFYVYDDPATPELDGREYNGTTFNAPSPNAGAKVTAELPSGIDVGDNWEYGIEDINGKNVDITIETIWTLEGLEDPTNGTLPHEELVTVGEMMETISTVLTDDISATDNTIQVDSTYYFPEATEADPSVIRIDDELILYKDKDGTNFLECERGYGGTLAAEHFENTTVHSEEVTYKINITYDNSLGNLKIDRIGAWLPPSFNYVPGTSNVATELTSGIFSSANSIPVTSTELFPDSGYIAIENEIIYYGSKDADTFDDCLRGQNGTIAADHSDGTPVSAEPVFQSHHGGTAITWELDSNHVDFEDLPREVALSGGEPPDEFPVRRTITFSFSPAGQPAGIFSWVRTNRNDVYLSWDTSGGTFKITSTATDPETGTHTSLESYVSAKRLTGRTSQVQGDARVIGNSLMLDNYPDIQGGIDHHLKDTILDESSAYIGEAYGNEIPDGATVEAAYLYWSAFKARPQNISGEDLADLAEMVNKAVFNGTPITIDPDKGDKTQIQASNAGDGWVFSCRADVTDLLEPPESANITISPATGATESVTIYDEGSGDLDVSIYADSGNPDNMVVIDEDGSTIVNIAPGQTRSFSPNSPQTIQLSSGSTAGSYSATITVTGNGDVGRVDGDGVDNVYIYRNPPPGQSNHVDVTLDTSPSGPPQAIITKAGGTSASVTITNNTPNSPDDPDNDVTVDGDLLEAGETDNFGPYLNANPHTILGAADDQSYNLAITCTEGIIKVVYNNGITIFLGEPGSQMTNGTYTLGLDPDDPFIVDSYGGGGGGPGGGSDNGDLLDEGSYAGWSLIIVYSHPDEEAHQLFLYDTMTYLGNYADNVGGYLETTISGFVAPVDFEGYLTYFVGEGDVQYGAHQYPPTGHYLGRDRWADEEYISLNGHSLYDDEDPIINPQWNIMNCQSSVQGIVGDANNGVDIDTYNLAGILAEGESAATLKLDTGVDGWTLVYIFLAFKTVPTEESGQTPVAVNTFGFK